MDNQNDLKSNSDNTLNNESFSNDDGAKRILSDMEKKIRSVRSSQLDMLRAQMSLKEENKRLREQLEKTNQMYNMGVLMLVFQPLKKGVSQHSVLKTIGFYAACCLFSKSFREDVKSLADEMLYPVIKKKAEQKPDSVWAKRKRRVEADAENHKLTLTPEAISMVRIELCKQAYFDMRQPDVSVRDVLSAYRDTEEDLYRIAYENGISREILDAYSVSLVSELIEEDESNKRYFSELAYSDVVLSEDGHYKYQNGVDFPYFFTPRRPETANNMRFELSKAWDSVMSGCLDMDGLKSAVFSEKTGRMQSDFLDYICDDNRVDRKVYIANQSVYVSNDNCWMTDYHGPDPFYEDGILQTFDDFMEHGPQPVKKFVIDDVPEFKSALGRWLNQYPEYSPAYYQRKANALYVDADDKSLVVDEIAELISKRNMLLEDWHQITDELFLFKTDSQTNQSVNKGYRERLKEVSRMGIQTNPEYGLTYERLNLLTAQLGSTMSNENQASEIDMPDFLL